VLKPAPPVPMSSDAQACNEAALHTDEACNNNDGAAHCSVELEVGVGDAKALHAASHEVGCAQLCMD
jgi:hypothetical protein